ncbi:hypothetical protein BKA61DRAFT_648166 [Leptodontidium sp. MPI-SDFR-AT-0119]|nr:hypothetical protein BKA61DRAFT_648166 [Leptodontidium sp. MPI-SDFR-AT-0119]
MNASTYTIKAGDTLSTIASNSETTVAALQQANPGINPNNLQVGQVIQLPQAASRYTVQAGDTFTSIAEKLGTTVAALQAANPGVNSNNLQIGAQLVIPSSTTPTQPAPPAPAPQPQPAPSGKYTIQSGDTFTTIAAKLGTSVTALQAANPGINPNALQIGVQISVPTASTPAPTPTPVPTQPSPAPGGKYTIQSGDTYGSIAAKLGTTVAAIQAANPGVNPNTLQVGSQINIPSTTQPSPGPVTPTPVPTAPATGTYVIQSGDTFTTIAAKFNTSVSAIEAANPSVKPTSLQVGQSINLPSGSSSTPGSGNTGGGGGGTVPPSTGGYVDYSGPASAFPSPAQWASYATLWAKNASLMSFSDSPSEIALIGSSIPLVASESNLDARVILCIIMQESGGNVRVGNTFNGVVNTGIMQAFNGSSFNPADPAGSILQMIRDGAMGTTNGPGLKQAWEEFGNYYEAARKYNSGSVDRNQLNNPLGATAGYVRDLANRLMGHTWADAMVELG